MCYSVVIEQDISTLERILKAKAIAKAYEKFSQMVEAEPGKYKSLTHKRIFPFYFASVMYQNKDGERVLEPMRYQVFPESFESDPTHLTLYNARLDHLDSAVWQKMFMHNHGLVIIRSFYEWVSVSDLLANESNGVTLDAVEQELSRRLQTKKEKAAAENKPFKLSATEKLPINERKITIRFDPLIGETSNEPILALPVLFCSKKLSNQYELKSFAILTTEPPKVVSATGHDRCPVVFPGRNTAQKFLEPWATDASTMSAFLHSLPSPNLKVNLDTDL